MKKLLGCLLIGVGVLLIVVALWMYVSVGRRGGKGEWEDDDEVSYSLAKKRRQYDANVKQTRRQIQRRRRERLEKGEREGNIKRERKAEEPEKGSRPISSIREWLQSSRMGAQGQAARTAVYYGKNRRQIRQRLKNQPLITIKGEESSGTNLLRMLLQKNAKGHTFEIGDSKDSDWVYGHKHTQLLHEEIDDLLDARDHFLLVIVRDIFTWLDGSLRMAERHDFSDFIRSKRVMRCKDIDGEERSRYYENHCDKYLWHEPNPIKLRQFKYANWLNAVKLLGSNQSLIVRYEDLAADQEGTFRYICEHLPASIQCNDQFAPVKSRVKYKEITYQRVRPPEEIFCQRFDNNPDDYAYVLRNLDADFEKQLGYAPPPPFADAVKMCADVVIPKFNPVGRKYRKKESTKTEKKKKEKSLWSLFKFF